jgi:DNA-directed RNA polymerase specialized sigma24 family protein
MVCCGRERSANARGASAFESFYLDHEDQLYEYVARRLDARMAEAVVAECFALAWAEFATLDSSVCARTWLFGLALERLRTRRHDELEHLHSIARRGLSVASDAAARVASALVQLDAVDRDMLTLHLWAGVSHDTVASLVGVPVAIVERRVTGAYEFVQRRATGP